MFQTLHAYFTKYLEALYQGNSYVKDFCSQQQKDHPSKWPQNHLHINHILNELSSSYLS